MIRLLLWADLTLLFTRYNSLIGKDVVVVMWKVFHNSKCNEDEFYPVAKNTETNFTRTNYQDLTNDMSLYIQKYSVPKSTCWKVWRQFFFVRTNVFVLTKVLLFYCSYFFNKNKLIFVLIVELSSHVDRYRHVF